MPVSPTGLFSAPIAETRTVLSECPAFQEWVEAANAAAALAHIFEFAADAADVAALDPKNYAIVLCGDDYASGLIGIGSGTGTWRTRGSVGIVFEGIVPEEHFDSHADANYWFHNYAGAFWEELLERFHGNTRTQWYRGISLAAPPARADAAERKQYGDLMQCAFEVMTGFGGGAQ